MSGWVGFTSPFVPGEWIEAHGLRTRRVVADGVGPRVAGAGVCPFAAGIAEAAAGHPVVLTTTCDQMRRAAEQMQLRDGHVFLMNVPATWQTDTARRLYVEELRRLGRFLVRVGGKEPDEQRLREIMREHEQRRRKVMQARGSMSGRGFAQAILDLAGPDEGATCEGGCRMAGDGEDGKRLALVGGPLRRHDWWIYDLIEELGARLVLDATETGERCLPALFDESRMNADPLGELARAYFDAIPDPFRRPDTLLHDYLRTMLPARKVSGVVLVRHLWCDQWHAQVQRVKEAAKCPVVEVDLGSDEMAFQRTRTRIESLVGILS